MKRGHEGQARRCFRCLGLRHSASVSREPPRCWRCGGFGHRRSGCLSRVKSKTAMPPLRMTQRPLTPMPPAPRVSVGWSKEVQDRVHNLRLCVLASWSGRETITCEDLVCIMGQKWGNFDLGNAGWLCRNRAIIRLPTASARDIVLEERLLETKGGTIHFSSCDAAMGRGRGLTRRISLFGIPLAWRTEEVIRRIVEPLGLLQNMFEDADGAVDFPPLSVSIWSNTTTQFPDSIEVSFGGWQNTVTVKEETIPRRVRLRRRSWEAARLVAAPPSGVRLEAPFDNGDGPLYSHPPIADVLAVSSNQSPKGNGTSVPRPTETPEPSIQNCLTKAPTPTDKGDDCSMDTDLTNFGANIGAPNQPDGTSTSKNGSDIFSLGSTPSIHGSLGQGSWANQLGEDGVERWVWFPTSNEGLSDRTLPDPFISPDPSANTHFVDMFGRRTLRSIVVSLTTSSQDSCGLSMGSNMTPLGLLLEGEACSSTLPRGQPFPQELQNVAEEVSRLGSSATALGTPDPNNLSLSLSSPPHSQGKFAGANARAKAEKIGLRFPRRKDSHRFMAFLRRGSGPSA
ncbi:hypothetical protein QJS10_CPB18g00700 [Acorus calamus]|uniref:CCHC-type domain-containing protein n=1 Tax=Acorus calamus TaxID=4465 RepID=A0AAV9CKB3_ACOCL|nr:hypothetical protein QJS10_CPB18g00700 [Acorus calamus]